MNSKNLELPPNWIKVDSSSNHLILSSVSLHNSQPTIKYSLQIHNNLTCSLTIYQNTTKPNYAVFSTKNELLQILKNLDEKKLCVGNDDNFMDLVTKRGGKLKNRAGKMHGIDHDCV